MYKLKIANVRGIEYDCYLVLYLNTFLFRFTTNIFLNFFIFFFYLTYQTNLYVYKITRAMVKLDKMHRTIKGGHWRVKRELLLHHWHGFDLLTFFYDIILHGYTLYYFKVYRNSFEHLIINIHVPRVHLCLVKHFYWCHIFERIWENTLNSYESEFLLICIDYYS